jgi:hypothetical protein
MWFVQVNDLDPYFYGCFFKPGVYGQTHRDHMANWHQKAEKGAGIR